MCVVVRSLLGLLKGWPVARTALAAPATSASSLTGVRAAITAACADAPGPITAFAAFASSFCVIRTFARDPNLEKTDTT